MKLASPLLRRALYAGVATATLAAGTVLAGSPAGAAGAAGTGATILSAGGPGALPGQYIVALRDTSGLRATGVGALARDLVTRHGGTVGFTYRHALRGFSVRMSEAAARRLAADPAVAFVEQDHAVRVADTQTNPPSWGLDRIDQRALPLSNSYTFDTTAANVHAYVIDTGVRITHTTFGGRAVNGFDAVDNDNVAQDGHGHGTHVAGTVGGSEYGVAKGVTIHAVRVLNNQGSGTTAQVVAGIDWVTGNAVKPAVANMSLGGGANTSIDTAVSNSINSGVSYAIAAGNGDIFGNPVDACTQSPARVPAAITVGATQQNDARASFSNTGTCLDIFAPGVGITSSWATSDTATNTISGTSMATPHVAGAAALILAGNPAATPQQVRDTMVANATLGVVTGAGTGSPNRLLFTAPGGGQPPVNDFSISVSPASGSTAPGGSVSATVSTAVTSGAAQTVNLSASGLPAGASAAFSPASVTAGGSATMTITTSASTPAGTFPVTVTGTGASATRSTTFTLTVTGTGGGCSGTNPTDVTIPDTGATVSSTIAISGCGRAASATSTVEVHIRHTYRGDLVVDLVAPDGTSRRLKSSNLFDGRDNIDQTFTVDLSTEAADGTWRLNVRDVFAGDTGFIDTWTLTL